MFEDFCSSTDKKEKSKGAYKLVLNMYAEYTGEDLSMLTKEYAQSFSDKMCQDAFAGKYSFKTVAVRLSYISAICDFAVANLEKYDYPSNFINHFAFIDKPTYTIHVSHNDIVTKKDLDKLCIMLKKDNPMLYAFVMLIAGCGLKPHEPRMLKFGNIIKDNDDNYALIFKKKNASEYIKLPDAVLDALNHYIEDSKKNCLEDDYIFTNRNNTPYGERGIQKMLKTYCDNHNLPNIKLYALRNSAAVYMLDGNASSHDVAATLRIKDKWIARYNGVVKDIKNSALDYSRLSKVLSVGFATDLRGLSIEDLKTVNLKIDRIILYDNEYTAVLDDFYMKGSGIYPDIHTVSAPLCVIYDTDENCYIADCLKCGSLLSSSADIKELVKIDDNTDIYAILSNSRKVCIDVKDKKLDNISTLKRSSLADLNELGSFVMNNGSLIYLAYKKLDIDVIKAILGDNYTPISFKQLSLIENRYKGGYSNGSGRQVWIPD